MDEFASKMIERAGTVLRQTFQQEPPAGMDSILELIGCLLEDRAGGVQSPMEVPVTIDEWLTWNEFVIERKEELLRTITMILESEKTDIPLEADAMRTWAASLLLATLDQMEME